MRASKANRPCLCFAGSSLERFEHILQNLLARRDLFGVAALCQAWKRAHAAIAAHGKHKLLACAAVCAPAPITPPSSRMANIGTSVPGNTGEGHHASDVT